jgi:pSer/pThr/pTyr-binding forkhead associated (FHA) protein
MGQVATEHPPGSAEARVEAGGSASITGSWATLYVEHGGQALRLAQRDEFTLGRSDESRTTGPDIDLSPFEAYANGVSRMHAIIRHRAGSIVLIDLGSANGTYVNGRRLGSRQEAGLEDGDMIALGALKFQIRLKATKREGRKET